MQQAMASKSSACVELLQEDNVVLPASLPAAQTCDNKITLWLTGNVACTLVSLIEPSDTLPSHGRWT